MPKDTVSSIFDLNDRIEVDPNALIAELGRIHSKAQSSSESSSTLGHQRKTAAEQLGCHKKALTMIEQIDGFSDEKLGDFLRSFLPMVQAMAPQWLKRMRDLVDQAEAEAKGMEGDLS